MHQTIAKQKHLNSTFKNQKILMEKYNKSCSMVGVAQGTCFASTKS
jgi:hypothetical protein